MKKLEQKLGFEFSNQSLLKQAFIHRSYVNEHKDQKLSHNERMEFLGDAVLELVVTEHLYHNYVKKSEGVLTTWRASLVKGETLAKVADDLELGKYLKLSKGEEKGGGREKKMILADCTEAVLGAIYLDQGYNKAKIVIKKHIIKYLSEIIAKGDYIDSKTFFQEKAQEEMGQTPTYEVLESSGPDHDKKYTVGVYLNSKLIAKGKGPSKQKAQQSAAQMALNKEIDLNAKSK